MTEADIKAIADEMIRRYPENLNSISIEGKGFMLGATWGLERGTARFAEIRTSFHRMNKRLMDDIIAKNGRIEELESKLKLADRNNELLRGHRDQLEADTVQLTHVNEAYAGKIEHQKERIKELEAQYKVLDGVAGKIEKERQELEAEAAKRVNQYNARDKVWGTKIDELMELNLRLLKESGELHERIRELEGENALKVKPEDDIIPEDYYIK